MSSLVRKQDYFVGQFNAMASPCQVLIDTSEKTIANDITRIASCEARRIELKLSRYREDNIIYQINSGETITVDNETGSLLDYAKNLFELSNGLFDITAGVLRRAWHFDGSDNIPEQADIDKLLPLIGWEKIEWSNPVITLPAGMEIDLGGIGKEYAVDRAAQLVRTYLDQQDVHNKPTSVLLNFGGDIAVLPPRHQSGRNWTIGVDTGIDGAQDANNLKAINQKEMNPQTLITMSSGGLATSGDSRRFLKKGHTRYGHILDPRTGWPVKGAPTSATVAAETCTDAGMLSTLALLHGPDAESFLIAQGVDYWLH